MPADHLITSVPHIKSQNITLLGATGSVGLNALDVITRHPERYRVFALSGMTQLELLTELCVIHRPFYAVVAHAKDARAVQNILLESGSDTLVLYGERGLETIAAHPLVNTVVSAIVGAAGLKPTLAAVNAGKKILLANKEALVMSGALFMEAVSRSGALLLPIDSEHNAIFQCLPVGRDYALADAGIRRIVLTASGGPFREAPLSALNDVTPEQACAHPKWSMGRKISVDSASMMNKGLELIEACWLFGATPDQVEVVIHPQSVIHSLVDYVDGSMLAQLGNPDMRIPISHALAWPERIDSGVKPLDLCDVARLDFEQPDDIRFPCLELARQAAKSGGTAPAMLNAVNEVAVAAFLSRRIRFTQIAEVISAVLEKVPVEAANELDVVLAADSKARALAIQWLDVHDR